MGSFILESIRMKVLIAGLLCATVALALPEGRRLRAEEHWRPAQGRDLSKYKPRQAMVPATAENLAWAIKEVKKTGASTKKEYLLEQERVEEVQLEGKTYKGKFAESKESASSKAKVKSNAKKEEL